MAPAFAPPPCLDASPKHASLPPWSIDPRARSAARTRVLRAGLPVLRDACKGAATGKSVNVRRVMLAPKGGSRLRERFPIRRLWFRWIGDFFTSGRARRHRDGEVASGTESNAAALPSNAGAAGEISVGRRGRRGWAREWRGTDSQWWRSEPWRRGDGLGDAGSAGEGGGSLEGDLRSTCRHCRRHLNDAYVRAAWVEGVPHATFEVLVAAYHAVCGSTPRPLRGHADARS